MFAPDVVRFREFYATPLGEAARSAVASAMRELWPQAKGDTVLGIGYCPPYLGAYLGQATPVAIAMPALGGAAYWPPGQANLVFLSHESELPLADNSINRVLLMHSLETTEHLSAMMDEVWRVLTPGGRVLAIAPNRLGLWSHASKTPFGTGRPFSMAQLRDLMTAHQFTLTRSGSALFTPPLRFQLLWRAARFIESTGKFFCPFIGGVLLVEAEKQLYAAIKQPVAVRKRYVPIPKATPALGMKRKVL